MLCSERPYIVLCAVVSGFSSHQWRKDGLFKKQCQEKGLFLWGKNIKGSYLVSFLKNKSQVDQRFLK